ncbi:MAG: WYL domain-containing protein, partial [Bacteroidales bacterium]|nr:WYL domain-containing protein [Bacteroidales bacterium]
MPANKNAVTRYYILDRLLGNRYHNYSTEDLRQLVNEELKELRGSEGLKKNEEAVSLRTIQGDLHYLEYEGLFLTEIEHYQIDVPSQKNPNKTVKKTCHRYADPSFSIFKKEMTEDEKYLLSEALSLLGQFDGLPNLEGLEALRKSLNVKTDRQIISFTKNPLENSTLLGELFTAISQRQVVELHYHRFDTPDEERTVTVHPYLLKEYNRRWYLIAAAEEGGKLLNFALDRLDKVVPLPSHVYVPYDGDLNERFEDIVGVTLNEDKDLQTIVFWVSNHSKDYVATKPIHESQCNIRGEREAELREKYPTLCEGRFFSIDCIENYELIRELTSFGKDLIVLSPQNIVEQVQQRIIEMQNEYAAVFKKDKSM